MHGRKSQMKLGYITTTGPGAANRTLASLAERLERRGVRLAGTVQTNTESVGGGRCDMDVRVLDGGPVIRISQSLGAGSRGCRLDPAALEQAVGEVASRLNPRIDLVIINKFGKHEAEGRGFRPLVADALERGLTLLIAVNGLNLDAFLKFADGLAEELPSDAATIEQWLGFAEREAAA